MSQISLRDTSVLLRDGTTPTANTLELIIGEGNVTWTETRALEYTRNRGALEDRRLADEEPMSVNIDLRWDYYRGGNGVSDPPSPVDAMKFQNNASTWISTDPDACRPKCIDVVLNYEPDCQVTDSNEEIVLPMFFAETFDYDPDEGTIAVTGTCLATEALSTRSTP